MFERFTHAARAVVIGAQDEARRLKHPFIGTEHLLLSLLRTSDTSAALLAASGITVTVVDEALATLLGAAPGALGAEDAAALRAIGIDLDEVQARIQENFGPVPLALPPPEPRRWRFGLRRQHARRAVPIRGHIPFSGRAKKVLELSLRESLRLNSGSIGAEHLLLGLLREGGGLAARVLADAGVDHGDLRARTEAVLRRAAA